MKKNYGLAAGILVVFFCILLGCEKKEKEQEELLLLPATDAESDAEEPKDAAEAMKENAFIQLSETDDGTKEIPKVQYCVVHICGAVKEPGVYTLEDRSRIYQAVEKAGGFREDADQDYLNQADQVSDGMKIYIPTKTEVEETGRMNYWENSGTGDAGEKDFPVNINTAGEELLCTLPGVGSSKAKSIIAYREKNGLFEKKEDIMNVEGIKNGLFEKIKDSITV
ncbi:MAG: helix-hairpin-helix domain-containing protein [Lachnospiraceae bacterium]|nr:helix-hairpin-helix domain-containing protein [Lachnospiraceae bacterium]